MIKRGPNADPEQAGKEGNAELLAKNVQESEEDGDRAGAA